jgi:hypothetical protein
MKRLHVQMSIDDLAGPFREEREWCAVRAAAGLWLSRDDGTLRTPDGSRGAQFEHTMIITRDGPIVVT